MKVWAVQVTVSNIHAGELHWAKKRLSWFFKRRLDTQELGGDVTLSDHNDYPVETLTMYCIVEGADNTELDTSGIYEALKHWPIKIQVAELKKVFQNG